MFSQKNPFLKYWKLLKKEMNIYKISNIYFNVAFHYFTSYMSTNTTFASVLIYISPSGASNFLSTLGLFDLFFN